MAKWSLYLVVLAVLSPYLYDRYLSLSTLIANRPGKYQNVYNVKSHEVKFGDRIRNCEDVILEEGTGIAFLSCDPGRDRWNTVMGSFHSPLEGQPDSEKSRIWIYDYSTPNLPDSKALKPLEFKDYDDPTDFHPLGIEFDDVTSTLYVINHSRQFGSVIEVFQVSISQASAKHVKRFKHPLIHSPNSIHSLGDGKLLVTNDHYFRAAISPLLSKIETFANIPGGSVVFANIRKPEETKSLAHLGFANGVAMINSTTLAVTSTAKSAVYLYTMDPADYSLTLQTYIRLPAAGDNLSVDSNGKVLIGGHPFAPTLMEVAKGRAKCNVEGSEEEKRACGCTAPSWVGEWSEEGGLRVIYQDSGEEFCSSTTYARDVKRGLGIVSGLYARGILVLKE